RLWPAKSATSSSVGLPAVFAVTSAIPPVAVPAGSGFDGGGGAGAAADAAGAAGAAGLSWANTQPPAASKAPTTSAVSMVPDCFMNLPSSTRVKNTMAPDQAPLPSTCDFVVACCITEQDACLEPPSTTTGI